MNAPDANEHVVLKDFEKKVTVVKDTKIVDGAIFYFAKEDHTLGNALRMSLLRDKDVRFAGYRMPHPLQFVCEVKVQTTSSNVRPIDVMITALEALDVEFATLENRFKSALGMGHRETMETDIMQVRY
jgi:DNA-directed RNA polymerase II subunit RPB11